MRWIGMSTRLVFLCLLVVAGCNFLESDKFKPPKLVESYVLPPDDDRRFNNPVEYPKGMLNSGPKKEVDPADGTPPPGRIPSQMSGMGMGGG